MLNLIRVSLAGLVSLSSILYAEDFSDEQLLLLKIDELQQRAFNSSEQSRLRDLKSEIPKTDTSSQPFDKFLKPIVIDLTPGEKRALVTRNILFKSETLLKKISGKKILDFGSWEDLNLLTGTTSDLDFHLLSRLFSGKTLLGEAISSVLLVTPTDDIRVLTNRQKIIKRLIESPKEFSALEKEFDRLATEELNALSLWSAKDLMYDENYKIQMDQVLYWNMGPFRLLNSNRVGLTIGNVLTKFIAALPKITITSGAAVAAHGAITGGSEGSARMGLGAVIAAEGAILSSILPLEKVMKTMYLNLKSRMKGISVLLTSAKNIYHTIKKNPELYKAYKPYIGNLEHLISEALNDQDIRTMLDLASHKDFNGNGFYTDAGYPTLRMYKIFEEKHQKLTDALVNLGYVEAFLSIAKTMKQHSGKKNKYIYPEYRGNKSTPEISANEFWNPFLDSDITVGNSLVMQTEYPGPQNKIITGPNAGGKSTYITGIMLNVLLAQSFGIAAAKDFGFTPFSKLGTYIHPSDDIAAGNSLYMAEVLRAKKHIESLQSLEDGKFSFAIMDEIFSGTNPLEGAAAAYSIAEYLADFKNSLNIIATHFPVLTKLEEKYPRKGAFQNYKVFVELRPNEKIKYTYKVVRGISDQTIAIDILEEQGFDTSMLKRAKEILQNPSAYYD
ncbi:MAG: hypothetical protein H6618_01480 [Deltaproteobacteria bacterium]|nr:hypothetical protein [Deltaproteobacteria bacterium]